MQAYKKLIPLFLHELQQQDIIKSINPTIHFNDDPKLFRYTTTLNNKKKFSDGKQSSLSASGLSATSRETALFKCLAETIERLCLVSYRKNSFVYKSFNQLGNKALDPHIFLSFPLVREKKFCWLKGFRAIANKACYIPSQLIYINYSKGGEPTLSHSIGSLSTGAAGGFDHETTLTRAIYEIVERDAYMGMYLNKITPIQINLSSIKNKTVSYIDVLCKRYNLSMLLFNITNDLQIPSFMALLIDQTGLGQAMCAGLKSSLNQIDAIVGSMEEAFLTRPGYRRQLYTDMNPPKPKYSNKIHTTYERSLFWTHPRMLSKIHFLFKAKAVSYNPKPFLKSKKQELDHVLDTLAKKNFHVYCADISLPFMKKLNYRVYKAVIPQLQPLYLNEEYKELRKKRLQQIAIHFGQKHMTINTLPHFFL